MSDKTVRPEDLLPLTPAVFHILLSLSDGESHGYGIMKEIAERTNDELRVGPGTLYTAIKRLLESGCIEEADEGSDPALDNERRKYYRITKFGKEVAQLEVRRLERLLQAAHQKGLVQKGI